MTDLAQIYEAIGGLKAQVGSLTAEQTRARERDEKIFAKLDELRQGQVLAIQQQSMFVEKQRAIDTRLTEAERVLDNYKTIRNVGGFIWAGTMAASGLIGHYLPDFLNQLFRGRT